MFFDSSILLAVFLADHEHHGPSLAAFLKANPREGSCAAHSLAEIYATATRLPGKHRVSGDQVLLFLENIRERLSIVALTAEEYSEAMKDAAVWGVAGGAIYDALIAMCAIKSRADCLFTWNLRHFQRFSPAISQILRSPAQV